MLTTADYLMAAGQWNEAAWGPVPEVLRRVRAKRAAEAARRSKPKDLPPLDENDPTSPNYRRPEERAVIDAAIEARRLETSLQKKLDKHTLWLEEKGGQRAILASEDLAGANLSNAKLAGADLKEANLSGANLSGADLLGVDLRKANLTGADLREAILDHADLREAILIGANLTGANLRKTKLAGADLSNATGADLRSALNSSAR